VATGGIPPPDVSESPTALRVSKWERQPTFFLSTQRFLLLLRASEYAATTSSSRASDNVAIDVHAGQRRQPLILKKVNGLYAKTLLDIGTDLCILKQFYRHLSLRLEPPTNGCLLSGIRGKASLQTTYVDCFTFINQ